MTVCSMTRSRGHEPLKVGKSAIFKRYLAHLSGADKWPQIVSSPLFKPAASHNYRTYQLISVGVPLATVLLLYGIAYNTSLKNCSSLYSFKHHLTSHHTGHLTTAHASDLSMLDFLRVINLHIIRSTPSSRPNKVGLKCPSARPSTKRFFDFNETWYVVRGRRVMHDGMQYDPIQGQGHESLKVGKSAIFKRYLAHLSGADKWPRILILGHNT